MDHDLNFFHRMLGYLNNISLNINIENIVCQFDSYLKVPREMN
jgi:hypothetical protein